MDRFLLHVYILLLLIYVSVPAGAKDDTCIDSQGFLSFISPGNQTIQVQEIIENILLGNGYSKSENQFQFPDRDCFVILENNGSVRLQVYIFESQMSELDELLQNLSDDLYFQLENRNSPHNKIYIIIERAIHSAPAI